MKVYDLSVIKKQNIPEWKILEARRPKSSYLNTSFES